MNKNDEAMKIPQAGCDRLTDPSEIAALGKYLKKKKDALQDSITLKGDPTKTATSELRNDFRGLGGSVERLNTGGIKALERAAATRIIGKPGELDSLGSQRVEAEGLQDNTDNKLSGNLETLEGSIKPGQLGDSRTTIQGNEKKIKELDGRADGVVGEIPNPSLESWTEKIQKDKDPLLDTTIESVGGERKETSLSDELLGLGIIEGEEQLPTNLQRMAQGEKDPELGAEVVRKADNQSLGKTELRTGTESVIHEMRGAEVVSAWSGSLGTDNEKIKGDIEDPTLGAGIEKVQGVEALDDLTSTLEKIGVGEEGFYELPTSDPEKLEAVEVKKLETNTVNLTDIPEVSLGDSFEKIEGEKTLEELNPTLENVQGDKINASLGTEAEKVGGDEKEVNLSTQSEKIGDEGSVLIESLEGNEAEKVGDLGEELKHLNPTLETVGDVPEEMKELGGEAEKVTDLSPLEKLPIENALDVPGVLEGDTEELSTISEKVEGTEKEVILPREAEGVVGEGLKESPKLTEAREGVINPPETNPELGKKAESVEFGEGGFKTLVDNLRDDREKVVGGLEEITGLEATAEGVEGDDYKNNFKEIPQVNAETVEGGIGDGIARLNSEAEKVEGGQDKDVSILPDTAEKVDEGGKKTVAIRGEALEVPDIENKIEGLGDNAEKVVDLPEEGLELGDHREDIAGVPDLDGLGYHREDLTDNRDIELKGDALTVGDLPDDPNLSDHREDLTDERENELSDHREDLDNIPDIPLSEVREDLTDNREIDLSDERLDLTDDRETDLSDVRLDLTDDRETPLSDHREDLTDERENELSDHREDLTDDRENELSNFREDLTDDRETPLSDERLDLDNIPDIPLSDFLDVLGAEEDNELSKERLDLVDDRENELSKERLDLDDIPEVPLSDERLDLTDDRETDLSDVRLGLDNIPDIPLSDVREDLETEEVDALSDFLNELTDDRDVALSDERLDLVDDRENELSQVKKEVEADDEKINIGSPLIEGSMGGDSPTHTGWGGSLDDRIVDPEDKNEDSFNPDEDGLYEGALETDKTEEPRWDESLTEDIIKREKDEHEDPLIGDLISIIKSRGNLQTYYSNILKFAQNKDLSGSWGQKVSGLMSVYLSSDNVSEARLKEFEKQLFKGVFTEYETPQKKDDEGDKDLESLENNRESVGGEKKETSGLGYNTQKVVEGTRREVALKNDSLYVAKYKLNWSWQNVLNMSQYLRWVAEQATFGSHGSLRALLLDTTLMTLAQTRMVAERLAGANRDRVPGGNTEVGMTRGDLVEAGKSAARKIAKAGIAVMNPDLNNLIDKAQPLNRPADKWELTTAFQPASNRRSTAGGGTSGEILKSVGKAIDGEVMGLIGLNGTGRDYDFAQHYTSSGAISVTLSELCGVTSAKSVEDLRTAIEGSPVMTSAEKVTTTKFNEAEGKVTTLDDNSNWEILLFPYIDNSNGRRSYLPSTREINIMNSNQFGLTTFYGPWIPITSFELSKSKLVSKTLQLYNGEISYPVGMEYTNELRLTIADDQYKSWRRYFELCADCAVYNSTLHRSSYYQELTPYGQLKLENVESNYVGGAVSKVDKTFVCPAPYKNITFQCVIYCMTPQKETIDRYNLLVVLKDISEERTGDVEAGGSDLTVSFSIVGENPGLTATNENGYYFNKNNPTQEGLREGLRDSEKAADKAALAMSIAQVAANNAVDGALVMI